MPSLTTSEVIHIHQVKKIGCQNAAKTIRAAFNSHGRSGGKLADIDGPSTTKQTVVDFFVEKGGSPIGN